MDCLQTKDSDIELLAQSKLSHTPEKFCWHGSLPDYYLNSLFGVTFQRSELTTQTHEATLSTFEKGERNSPFVAGSRNYAKTSAQPEMAQVSTESAQACGATSHVLLAKYDPSTHSLKTAQCSLLEDLTECSVTLPRWGSMRNGDVYLQVKSARITGVTESGLWQTPTSTQVPPRSAESWAKKQQDREATGRYTLPPGTLEEQVSISGQNPCWDFHKSPMNKTPDGHNYHHTPNTHGMDGGSNSRKALAARRLPWATPTTMDKLPPKSEQALFREMTIARPGRSQPANLRDQVSNVQTWPTPTANNYEQSDVDGLLDRRERVKISTGNGNGFGLTLGNAVAIQAKYPTPMSRDHHPGGKGQFSESLPQVIAKYPTPLASDDKDRGNLSTPAVQRCGHSAPQMNYYITGKDTKLHYVRCRQCQSEAVGCTQEQVTDHWNARARREAACL